MKIAEVIENAAQPIVVQPSQLQRKARVNKLVQQLAIADARQAQTGEPTAQELFFARKIFKQQKDKADAEYEQSELQRATNSAIAADTISTTASPTEESKRKKR